MAVANADSMPHSQGLAAESGCAAREEIGAADRGGESGARMTGIKGEVRVDPLRCDVCRGRAVPDSCMDASRGTVYFTDRVEEEIGREDLGIKEGRVGQPLYRRHGELGADRHAIVVTRVCTSVALLAVVESRPRTVSSQAIHSEGVGSGGVGCTKAMVGERQSQRAGHRAAARP